MATVDDKKVIFSMVGVSKTIQQNQKQVLKNIYLSFFYGAKIGIIGLNGAGKSTLMKIIAGLDQQYQGNVVWSPGYSVGYLPQDPPLDETKTVKENVMEGVQYVYDALKEYDEINQDIELEEAHVRRATGGYSTSDIFVKNYDNIMEGCFEKSLISHLPQFEKNALDLCREESVKSIYRHPSVVKIELTGFNVIGTLLEDFTDAVLNPGTPYNKKLLSLVPEQFKVQTDDIYTKLQSVIDFISNMTDLYAVQLYKDLRGIE